MKWLLCRFTPLLVLKPSFYLATNKRSESNPFLHQVKKKKGCKSLKQAIIEGDIASSRISKRGPVANAANIRLDVMAAAPMQRQQQFC